MERAKDIEQLLEQAGIGFSVVFDANADACPFERRGDPGKSIGSLPAEPAPRAA